MSARDDRRHGFFILDNEIVEVHGSTIGVFGVAVYAALAQQAGSAHRCHPSITYIAQTLNCSPRKVRDTLRHLEAVGLIATERRGGEKGERQTSSAYALLPVTKLEKYATQTPRPPARGAAPPARGAAPPARGAAPPRHVVPPLNKNYHEQELFPHYVREEARAEPTEPTTAATLPAIVADPAGVPVEARKTRTAKAGAAKPKATPDPRVKELTTALAEWQGYTTCNWAAEGAAAKRIIGAGYTLDDVRVVWLGMKAETFWRDKHLSLASVFKQLGAKIGKAGQRAERERGVVIVAPMVVPRG